MLDFFFGHGKSVVVVVVVDAADRPIDTNLVLCVIRPRIVTTISGVIYLANNAMFVPNAEFKRKHIDTSKKEE